MSTENKIDSRAFRRALGNFATGGSFVRDLTQLNTQSPQPKKALTLKDLLQRFRKAKVAVG